MSGVIYDMVFGHTEGLPGRVWLNQPKLIEGRFPPGKHKHPLGLWNGEGSGFPIGMEEPPIIVLDPARGRLPLADAEGLGGTFWLISDATRQVFERVDPEAFVFCPVEVRQVDGAKYEGSAYHLCDVIRFLDPLDEEKSEIQPYFVNGTKFTKFRLGKDAHFRADVLDEHHIFRLMFRPTFVGCDDVLRSAVESAKLTGFWFYRSGIVDA